MAAKKQTVEMFGTGNFVIDDTLYAFTDGSKVTVKDEKHIPILEAEAKRRKSNFDRVNKLTEEQTAKESIK